MPPLHNADLVDIGIILTCLMFSAFFSAAETAITCIGALRANHLLDSTKKPMKHLKLWIKKPSRVLTTILIFNNTINIFASAMATQVATRFFQSQAVGIATGIITILVLIFGEIIPKSFAKAFPEKFGLFALKIVRGLYYLLFPLVDALSIMTNFLIEKLTSKSVTDKPPITEDEIEYLIDVGKESGVIDGQRSDMISGVFDFHDTRVREIMTPRTDISALDEESASFKDAIDMVVEGGHSRIPLYKERIDNITGVIFAKDLLKASQTPKQQKNITAFAKAAHFTPESKSIMDLLKDLQKTKNHMAIVVDEYGGTAGLVTMEDIMEELVGEIHDEHDKVEQDITKIEDGKYTVTGTASLSDFAEFFEIEDKKESKESEVDTVGGWVTELIGELPEKGQKVSVGFLDIEVIEIGQRRIDKILVVKNTYVDENGQPLEQA